MAFISSNRYWTRLAALVTALSVLASFVAACGSGTSESTDAEAKAASTAVVMQASAAATPAFPFTITDSSGTKVEFTSAPRRIISLSAGTTETLYAIGAESQIVATDKFSDFPAANASKPKVEYSNPSVESAIAHNPDLVIMVTRQKAQVEQFRAQGLRVLYMEEPTSVDGVLNSILTYGRLTGHDAQAAALTGKMRERITAITSKLTGIQQGPRVFYEVTEQLHTVAPDTFIGSLLTLAKAQNVAQGAKTAFPQLTVEAVIAGNPEVIFLADSGTSGGVTPEKVSARPGWADVAAVKTKRIYPIDANTSARPGPRVVEGLEAMAKALYPERFP